MVKVIALIFLWQGPLNRIVSNGIVTNGPVIEYPGNPETGMG